MVSEQWSWERLDRHRQEETGYGNAALENTVVESEPSWNEPERFGLGSIEVRQQARLGASRGPRAE